ncbi:MULTISPECIES: hypothetical protein [Vibrio]|uniref:hypothetical protein n=1 Tax=Vibrio TaxID=662 RepID=UPI002075E801|nr:MULTISPECIES: hypothetical protein [Vibrio]USD32793.1 hypothetical protein J8Z27_01315 [Vibrio sp. SCSIO 43186]USD45833.1 hypothetical protein J4N38_01315 [Vibrio sp. SCSIO 43145]USD69918.1 hypothetical protein J4N41_01315 [Vibrio sp. SCSIO 43139]USD94825.1 hypothetical protein CTT30_01345 [Vibrio coralliilyticus]
MTKKHYVLVVALFASIAGALYVTFFKPSPQSITDEVPALSDKSSNALPKITLSQDANFPSPVIQLQQTIAHGLIEAERVDLPLLSGELAEFSQKNISEEYPSPPELENLKQRLKKLQSLSQ